MVQSAEGSGDRDLCEDTGDIPRIDAQHDGADDLADSSEGEPEDALDEELHAVQDELAAELAEQADERTRSDTPAVKPATVKPTTGRGSTTRFDPLADTCDPDRADTERIAAGTVADVVASATDLRAAEAASGVVSRGAAAPAPAPALTPTPMARPPIDEGRPPPRRDPTPSSPRMKVLLGVVGALPLALAGALVALGAPQAVWQRMSGRDPFEPNETLAQARPLGEGVTADLTCSPGDVDWFKVEAPAGRALIVDVLPAAIGRGGASLHGPDGVCVAASRQSATDDRVVFAPTDGAPAAATPLLLRVWGARGQYELVVRTAALQDRFEPNDTAADAGPLALGVTRAVRCSGTDWFRVHVPARHKATARVLSGPPGLSLAWGAIEGNGGGREVQAGAVGADRLALLQVAGDVGTYELEVSLSAPSSEEPARDASDGVWIESGEYPGLTCSGLDLWRLTARAGQVVDVTVRQAGDPWSVDLELLDASGTSLPASESRQMQGGSSTIRLVYQARRDGELVLRVNGAPVDYALALHIGATVQPGAPPAPTQTSRPSGAIQMIGPGVYPDEFVNGDAWFQLEVGQRQRVSAALDFSQAQGEISMELYDNQYTLVASSSSGADQAQLDHVAPYAQTMFLRVHGYGQANRYTLTLAYDGSATATTLEPGRHEGLTCAGNSVFRVVAPGGKRLVAQLAFEGADGDLDLQLLDADGVTLASSESFAETDGERVEYVPPVDQIVTVRVYNAKNTFALDLSVEEP